MGPDLEEEASKAKRRQKPRSKGWRQVERPTGSAESSGEVRVMRERWTEEGRTQWYIRAPDPDNPPGCKTLAP